MVTDTPLSCYIQMWLDVMQDEATAPAARSIGAPAMDNRPRESSGPDDWVAIRSPPTRQGSSFANPNDENALPTIVIQGKGPGRRAGHTATAVNRRFFYVFGGSCGSDYLVSLYC